MMTAEAALPMKPETPQLPSETTTAPTVDDAAADRKQWYAMRDLRPSNAREAAYERVEALGLRYFTPMQWVVSKGRAGKAERRHVPVIRDLLFICESREVLDPIVSDIPKLQYRYRRGGTSGEAIVVADTDMERFIRAVEADSAPVYFTPSELTPDMIGREIRVNGGPLDGYCGRLLKMQGSRRRRLIVALEGYLTAAVEVNPDFIQLL